MEEKEYSVSEAVRLIGVESHVLRYWEEELHVPVGRSAQGHRMYSERDIELFRRTKELKDCGIQLKAIRLLFEGEERMMDGNDGSEAEGEQETCQIARSVWKLDRLQPTKGACTQADKALAEERQAEEPSWESNKYGASEVQNKQERREEKTVEQDATHETADGQNQSAEHRTQDADTSSEESEPPVCEIIPDEKKENMRRFEAILKRLIAEVVEEQNEKLEKVLCEMIREEAANLFELYQSALEEAAAERETQKKHWIRAFLERCLGKKRL